MKSSYLFWGACSLIVLFVAVTARAQTVVTKGAIHGRVSDSSGGLVSGALVELLEVTTEAQQHRMTAKDGTFLFPALTIGQYSLKVTALGFALQRLVV